MVQLVPDTAELIMQLEGVSGSELEGCEAQWSHYVRKTPGAWIQVLLDQLAAFGRDWWQVGKNAGTPLADFHAAGWALRRVVARDLGSAAGLQSELVVNLPGALGVDNPPPQCAVLVRFALDPGGEPTRGRVYVPAGEALNIEGNNWNPSLVDGVVQAFIDFNTDLNDPLAGGELDWAQVRVSRASGFTFVQKKKAAPRVTAVTNTLSSITGGYEIASQRDRRASK